MAEGRNDFVIYVDDDMDDIELIEEMFRQYPHINLLTFNESFSLLAYITNEGSPTPALILIDINMPLLGGKELLAKLRSLNRLNNVMMALYTTSALPSDKTFAKNMHAQLVTKPITKEHLDRTILGLLRQCNLI